MLTASGVRRVALASIFLGGCAVPAARVADQAALHLPAPRVVDVSQSPLGVDLASGLLRRSTIPLVAYDGAHLEILRGCTLGGIYASKPRAPDAEAWLTTQVLGSARELDAALSFRDPALVIEDTPPGLRPSGLGRPIAVTSIVAEEWSLAALEHNEPPASEACARATHFVAGARLGASAWRRHDGSGKVELTLGGRLQTSEDAEASRDAVLDAQTRSRCLSGSDADCHRPLSIVLQPLGASRVDDAATLVHFRPKTGEDWSVEVDGTAVCKVPCERWLVPGAAVTLRRGDGHTMTVNDDFAGAAERDVMISSSPDPLYPWLGLGMGAFGLGLTGVTIGLLTGGAPAAAPGASSSGGVGAGAGKEVAGIAVMGIMGAALDIWSIVNLASGRQPVPELRLEGPGKHPTSATRRGPRGGAVTASPAGIGLSF